MLTLGINAPPLGWHDASACLVDENGQVLAFIEQERVSRVKHAWGEFPKLAIEACLNQAQRQAQEITHVAYGWDLPRHSTKQLPFSKYPQLPGRPWAFDDDRHYLRDALGLRWRESAPDLVMVNHHDAHAYSAFYASGFSKAAVLVMDGNGDDESISLYRMEQNKYPRRLKKWPIRHSLGYFYGIMTQRLGLDFLEAGKTMGLAAYATQRMEQKRFFTASPDWVFNPPFSLKNNTAVGFVISQWNDYLNQQGITPCDISSDQLVQSEHAVSIARLAQDNVQNVILNLARYSREQTGLEPLCLAGGVALNCSVNGLIDDPVFVPPMPHDAGVALGAAWAISPPKSMNHSFSPYLGSSASKSEVSIAAKKFQLQCQNLNLERVCDFLEMGLSGALCVGRSEVGPRALCHRSIISLPDSIEKRDDINLKKGRELWRPLSPVGLITPRVDFWQSKQYLHRYMLGASQVSEQCQALAPAIVHVNGTARVQGIENDSTELIADILRCLDKRGIAPILINTSLNTRGEPLAEKPEDAIRSALAIGLDFMVFDEAMITL